jgi:hypothetical protein
MEPVLICVISILIDKVDRGISNGIFICFESCQVLLGIIWIKTVIGIQTDNEFARGSCYANIARLGDSDVILVLNDLDLASISSRDLN